MDRGRQVFRQWRVLRALEGSRRGLSAEQILQAVEEECSIRTIYRDLDQLREVGFPLVDEEGRWRLAPGEGKWTAPITPSQVLSLLLSESLLQPLEGSYLVEPLAELRSQLWAMLRPEGREWCDQLRVMVATTLPATARYGERQEVIDALGEALQTEQRVMVDYESPKSGRSLRKLDPYLSWYDKGRLYVVAWCHKAQDYRTFAVQRCHSVEILDETFERDPDFDPARFIHKGFGVFHGATRDVVIEFHQEVAYLLRERSYHPSQKIEEIEGGIRVSYRMAGVEEIAAWVAGFGGRALPISPPELVERVRWIHAEGSRALVSGRVVTSDVKGSK